MLILLLRFWQKAKAGKWPKSRKKKRFRLKNREGWARRCENGAFDTEIVRGIRWLYTLGTKRLEKRKVARSIIITIIMMRRGKKRKLENGRNHGKKHVFGRK